MCYNTVSFFIYDMVAEPIKFQKHGHLNMICIMTIPLGMSTCIGMKSYKALPLHQRFSIYGAQSLRGLMTLFMVA